MAYLFHHHQRFILIDETTKNGVYCQFFSPHASKPLQIAPPSSKAYCSFMDEQDQLYVAVMPDAFHLNLHLLDNNRFTKKSLIANTSSNYTLSDPMLYAVGGKLSIAYLSHQANTSVYHFVQENIDSPDLNTLYTLSTPPTKIKCFSPNDETTYIFFITHEENYCLFALEITPHQTSLIKYLTSPVPIVDYSICLHHHTMHITYVVELHGKYQLCYFNNLSSYITAVMTTLTPPHPVVFCYYHALWINLQLEQEVQLLLSMDQGHTFSLPVSSSLQNGIKRCYFSTDRPALLTAHELYASVTSSLRLCTIAMADFYHFHSDTFMTPELELLMEGLTHLPQADAPAPKPSEQPREQAPIPSSKKDIESAKKAFMNEFDSWDLPPRI